MPNPVIVATARSPIGRAHKGSLVDVRPDDLGGFIVQSMLEKVPAVDPASVDDVIVGAASLVGMQNWVFGRLVAQLAGLPDSVPGISVSRGCASSLESIRMAAHAISAGIGDTYVAAGVESTTHTDGKGMEASDANPRFYDKSRPDFVNPIYLSMGMTAEIVAERFDVSRRRMDEFAVLSQTRYAEAEKNGFFEREITPVVLPDGSTMTTDDSPRRDTTVDALAELKPVFKPDGKVTAGNSCPLNDGAAAVLVMDEDKARSLGITPLARIITSAVTGVDPRIMGVGPIEAVRTALGRAGMTIGDIDVVELNEAFAAQVLPVCDELGIDIDEQLNPHGGAIAMGHPYGMTGARIMGTLINDLQTLDKTIGVETMCIGTGMGMAMIIERLS